MSELSSVSNRAQVLDTMVALTRLSHLHRAIIAGRDNMQFYLALRERGFLRVGTPATCRIPRGQCAVGLMVGADSPASVESALAEVSRFLSPNAAVATLICSEHSGAGMRIRERLQQLGFRIEAGVRCHEGFVLSAVRRDLAQMKNAA